MLVAEVVWVWRLLELRRRDLLRELVRRERCAVAGPVLEPLVAGPHVGCLQPCLDFVVHPSVANLFRHGGVGAVECRCPLQVRFQDTSPVLHGFARSMGGVNGALPFHGSLVDQSQALVSVELC